MSQGMPQENVELVLSLHAAVNGRDLEAFVAAWHPDGEYRAAIQDAVEGEAGAFRGHAGIREWWRELHDVWDDFNTRVLEIRDLGDAVVVVFVVGGRGSRSGIANAETLAHVVRVRQRKVVELHDYRSREEAFRAAGLSAPPALSLENVECLRQAEDAFNRRDRAAWLALCDPDLENVSPRGWPEAGPSPDREAVWDFFGENMAPWEDSPLSYGELFDAGEDRVVAQIRGEVRGKASGATVPWCFWQVVAFRGGKAWRIEWFTEREDALRAVGLQE